MHRTFSTQHPLRPESLKKTIIYPPFFSTLPYKRKNPFTGKSALILLVRVEHTALKDPFIFYEA
jgi:hypothetical protein